jgi:glucose uptake protein GlcU
MTALLALTTILAWGFWIPVAQIMPGVPQRSRTFYVALGNAIFAGSALVIAGGHVSFGWRGFWLPLVGGVVWTVGGYSAFRASESIGLARASGSWTPLNIIVAFVWGALLFGEMDRFSTTDFVLLGVALVFVLSGTLFIVNSQDSQDSAGGSGEAGSRANDPQPTAKVRRAEAATSYRHGFLFAGAAGVLWGSYFIPAQWAKVPAQVANFPLALGILAAGTVLVMTTGRPTRLSPRGTAVQLSAGLLFGIGNIALLGLVARIGTGVGFTIAQLSLLVNVSVGILVFKVPRPGSRAARVAVAGILLAGVGGLLIGNLR